MKCLEYLFMLYYAIDPWKQFVHSFVDMFLVSFYIILADSAHSQHYV